MNKMKFIRIFLLILIIIGLGLIATQKIWVPKLVERILRSEEIEVNSSLSINYPKHFSPSSKYYVIQKYLKSEWVACCGSETPNKEKKYYSVSIYKAGDDTLVRSFTTLEDEKYDGYTPSFKEWYSDDILEMFAEGIIDAYVVYYDIPKNKLIPEWEFK